MNFSDGRQFVFFSSFERIAVRAGFLTVQDEA